jgi:hypothetical protein
VAELCYRRQKPFACDVECRGPSSQKSKRKITNQTVYSEVQICTRQFCEQMVHFKLKQISLYQTIQKPTKITGHPHAGNTSLDHFINQFLLLYEMVLIMYYFKTGQITSTGHQNTGTKLWTSLVFACSIRLFYILRLFLASKAFTYFTFFNRYSDTMFNF